MTTRVTVTTGPALSLIPLAGVVAPIDARHGRAGGRPTPAISPPFVTTVTPVCFAPLSTSITVTLVMAIAPADAPGGDCRPDID